jgi:HEAT repeat protein
MDAARYLPFLDDPSYFVRKAALEGLQNSGDAYSAWKHAIPLLNDPFWPVRRAAVQVLAAWPGPGSTRHVLEALKDPVPMVRAAALRFMDELKEDIPPAILAKASAGLAGREDQVFLEACLPLVRESNLSYFQERAEAEEGTEAGVFALCTASSLTRRIPVKQLPYLIDQVLDGGAGGRGRASLILTLAGRKTVPIIRKGLVNPPGENPRSPHVLVYLLLALLEKEAVPILASWILDRDLSMEVRHACLDGLTAKDWEAGAKALARIYPELEVDLKKRAVQKAKAFSLVDSPVATLVAPLLADALEHMDPKTARTAFESLCLLPEPPLDLLAQHFEEEEDPSQRKSYAGYLVNAGKGNKRCLVANLLFEEINKEADLIVAEAMEKALEGNGDLSLEFLVSNLGEGGGPATADLMHRIFPGAGKDLKKQILRTLVKRSDLRAVGLIEEVFSETTLSYRRSILDELAGSGLSEACGDLLRRIVVQEKDPDLLSSAIEAAPLSLLKELEARLIELADLGPELGMGTVEAIFDGLGRAGGPVGLSYLKGKATAFVEGSVPVPSDFRDGGPAVLARLAAAGLAKIRDPEAPALLAELLFLHALTFRGHDILALWEAESGGGIASKDHNWPRAVLSSLLVFEGRVVERAVFPVIEAWKKNGRLYQCGDAMFAAMCRDLSRKEKRCPALAKELANLTLACAPAFSPSDFRIHLLQAGLAERRGDHGKAIDALTRAYHILIFYPPAKNVVRDELGDSDPFQGYFPDAALASRIHWVRATLLESSGRAGPAAEEREWARRRSPFFKDR